MITSDEAKALVVLRKVGTINNWMYRIVNDVDTLTASQHLRRLRDMGLLEQQGKGSATHYTLPLALLTQLSSESTEQTSSNLESNSTDKLLSRESNSTDKPSSRQDYSRDKELYLNEMPESLKRSVESLGQRAERASVRDVIIALCQWRDLSSRELAIILKRDQVYLLNQYLNPLITSGSLVYTIPENPTAPSQAYRTNTNPHE